MTELATQLMAIREKRPTIYLSSFLFDLKDAQKIDSDIVFTIGINGYDELRDDLPQTELFYESFAEKHKHRDLLTGAQIDFLNQQIDNLIRSLAPHFQSQSCHKILEMLIRFYSVHIYSVNQLISAFFLHHDSKYFIRLLQICQLSGSDWEMLENYKKEGVIIQRKQIVKRCVKDMKLYSNILQNAQLSISHLRFAGIVCLEVIYYCQDFTKTFLTKTVQFMLNSLKHPHPEGKFLAFTIAVRLSLRQPFSAQYFQAILYDFIQFAHENTVQAIQTIGLLVQIHSVSSLPSNIIKSLKAHIEEICEISHSHNLKALLGILVKKLVADSAKGNSSGLLTVIHKAEIRSCLKVLLDSLFLQYLNTKNDDFHRLSIEVLNSVYLKYPDALEPLISESIQASTQAHPGKEPRHRLYNLLSIGLSGIGFDSHSDLPLVLSLCSPSKTVRLAALSQVPSFISTLSQSMINLIRSENHADVLLEALNLPLSSIDSNYIPELYQSLKDRFLEQLKNPGANPSLLRQMFRVLFVEVPIVSTDHIKLLCNCYSVGELRELCSSAALKATSHPLLLEYKGQELGSYFKGFLVSNWIRCHSYILEMTDCELVQSIIPQVIAELQTRDIVLDDLMNSLSSLIEVMISKQVEDQELFRVAIQVCPGSPHPIFKSLLIFLLPRNPELCVQILNKFFDDRTISVLLEASEVSSSALHLAMCLCIQKESVNGILQIIPYILVQFAREKEYRNSAVLIVDSFLSMDFPSLDFNFEIDELEDYEKYEHLLKPMKKCLRKMMKYSAGISQDKTYIQHALKKASRKELYGLIAEGFRHLKYGSDLYVGILSKIEDNELTDLLILSNSNRENNKFIGERLAYYTNWGNFLHEGFLIDCIESLDLKQIGNFAEMKDELKYRIFDALLRSGSHQMIQELPIENWIFIKALENPYSLTNLLEIIQQTNQYSEKLVKKLFKLLGKYDSDTDLQVIILTLRLGYSMVKASPNDFTIFSKLLGRSNSHTVSLALSLMVLLSQNHPDQMLKVLKTHIKTMPFDQFYICLKHIKGFSQSLDAGVLVEKLLEKAIESEMLNVGITPVIESVGTEYLHIIFDYLVKSEYPKIKELALKFSVEDTLSALNNMVKQQKKNPVQIGSTLALLSDLFDSIDFISNFPSNEILLRDLVYSLLLLKIKTEKKKFHKLVSKGVKTVIHKLNNILDNTTFKNMMNLFLEIPSSEHSVTIQKEVLHYLLERLEVATDFEDLIPSICSILESYVPSLRSIDDKNLLMYLQILLSVLYKLLDQLEDPSYSLGMYGNFLIGYMKTKSFEVRSAAAFAFSVFFRTKSTQILPFIETYTKNLYRLMDSEDEIISNCGKSCMSALIRGTEEFLSPHIETIVKQLCVMKEDGILDLVPLHLPLRKCIEILSPVGSYLEKDKDALYLLFELFEKIAKKIKPGEASVYQGQVFQFIQESFKILEQYIHRKSGILLLSRLCKSIAVYCLGLSNNQLRPQFLETYNWAMMKLEDTYDYPKLIIFFSFSYSLSESLRHLFTSYFNYFYETLLDILRLTKTSFSNEKKRARNPDKLLKVCNTFALQIIRSCCNHDKERFFTSEKYDTLSELITLQLSLRKLKYKFISSNVVPTVVAMNSSTMDQSIWQLVSYKVLLLTRNNDPNVKILAFQCICDSLTAVGKEYAALIADIMPFVAEALEDENSAVTDIARQLTAQLESVTGENIESYLN